MDGNIILVPLVGTRLVHERVQMFKTIPNPNREEFGFPEAVLQAFGFLEEKGFHCTQKNITLVRYESPRVFVNIFHGRASYELNAEIGLLTTSPKEKERAFSIGEIVELTSGQPRAAYSPPQSSAPEGVKRFVLQLASTINTYAGPALEGNRSFFEQLSQLRLKNSNTYLTELKMKHLQEEAEKAWRDKDYRRFLKLYEPVQQNLSAADRKKLAYARKRESPA